MRLVKSAGMMVTKYKNGENLPWLEITRVVLVHCNVANNKYQ